MKPTLRKLAAVVVISTTVTFALHFYLISVPSNGKSLVTPVSAVPAVKVKQRAGRRPEAVPKRAAPVTAVEERRGRESRRRPGENLHVLENVVDHVVKTGAAHLRPRGTGREGELKINDTGTAFDRKLRSGREVVRWKEANRGNSVTNRPAIKRFRDSESTTVNKSSGPPQRPIFGRETNMTAVRNKQKDKAAIKTHPFASKHLRNVTNLKQFISSESGLPQKRVSKRNNTGVGTKYLIYLCDSRKPCGGWGDRQRGIVNTFLLANVTSRRFGINMTFPCDVRHFFQPKNVNWAISEAEVVGKSVRIIDAVDSGTFQQLLQTIDFNKVYPEDVVFLRTNVEHYWPIRSNVFYKKLLPPWAQHGRPEMFRRGWNILMNPTKHMQDHVHYVLQDCSFFNKTSPFVCAHIRIGISKSNPRDSEKRNEITSLGSLWEFVGKYIKNGSDFFLATDSSDVREHSRKTFHTAHHDTGGKILHVDKQGLNKDACIGFESALLDQLVLLHCDILVTTNSMFSYRAALIRGTNNGLYHFDKDVHSPCVCMHSVHVNDFKVLREIYSPEARIHHDPEILRSTCDPPMTAPRGWSSPRTE